MSLAKEMAPSSEVSMRSRSALTVLSHDNHPAHLRPEDYGCRNLQASKQRDSLRMTVDSGCAPSGVAWVLPKVGPHYEISSRVSAKKNFSPFLPLSFKCTKTLYAELLMKVSINHFILDKIQQL